MEECMNEIKMDGQIIEKLLHNTHAVLLMFSVGFSQFLSYSWKKVDRAGSLVLCIGVSTTG